MSLKTYQESLAKKLVGAGSVIRDDVGRILLVKPTYHDGWITVGGIVEASESPLEAAMREMKEEIGIAVTPKRLLGVGYLRESEDRAEMLAFTFDAGVISGELIAQITLDSPEVDAYRFVARDEALTLFAPVYSRYFERVLPALDSGETMYLDSF
ncbi:MAG: NUDIX hydrolase [Truepera sp.]|nr:NUDIX hydrolase [Truepera sp.]